MHQPFTRKADREKPTCTLRNFHHCSKKTHLAGRRSQRELHGQAGRNRAYVKVTPVHILFRQLNMIDLNP